MNLFALCTLVAVLLPAIGVHADAAPKSLRQISAAQLKNVIASHRGSVVLVNFWATWCAPCVAEFPSLVKLSREHRDVAFVAVSADQGESGAGKAAAFVAAQRAAFPCYVTGSGDPSVFINAFDPAWQGDLPRTYIYNRRGKLARMFADEQSYKTFDQSLRRILASH
ncbi:MAG: TlpA family protein disulfide reductase [Capsulimonadaceae bacterium]|nr:TlpA family protein disulfide reductase [Capsulimonadaceae bacterium]